MIRFGMAGASAIIAFALAACGGSDGQGAAGPIATATAAAAAPDVSDLLGAQADVRGAPALAQRGYVIARRHGDTRFWWHQRSGQCLQVFTRNGRYRGIDPAAPSDCGR